MAKEHKLLFHINSKSHSQFYVTTPGRWRHLCHAIKSLFYSNLPHVVSSPVFHLYGHLGSVFSHDSLKRQHQSNAETYNYDEQLLQCSRVNHGGQSAVDGGANQNVALSLCCKEPAIKKNTKTTCGAIVLKIYNFQNKTF